MIILDISFHYSCVILISDSKTSEKRQIFRLALFDFEYNSKEVSEDSQTFDCIRRNSSQFDRTCLSLAQGHECEHKPLIVCRYISTMLNLVEEPIQGLSCKDIGGSDFKARIIGNGCSSSCLSLKTETIAWRERCFISFIVITINPNIWKIFKQFCFAFVFYLVQNTCRDLATCASSSNSFNVALFLKVYLVEFTNGWNDNMNMPSSIRQISSTNNFHREFIINLIVIFQERNQLGLNNINGIILWMIGQSMKVDIKSSFADDSHEQQIFKIIRNSSLQSTLEMQFYSFIVGDHTSKEFQQQTSLGYHHLTAI